METPTPGCFELRGTAEGGNGWRGSEGGKGEKDGTVSVPPEYTHVLVENKIKGITYSVYAKEQLVVREVCRKIDDSTPHNKEFSSSRSLWPLPSRVPSSAQLQCKRPSRRFLASPSHPFPIFHAGENNNLLPLAGREEGFFTDERAKQRAPPRNRKPSRQNTTPPHPT